MNHCEKYVTLPSSWKGQYSCAFICLGSTAFVSTSLLGCGSKRQVSTKMKMYIEENSTKQKLYSKAKLGAPSQEHKELLDAKARTCLPPQPYNTVPAPEAQE